MVATSLRRCNAGWCHFSESIARNIAVDDGGIDVERLEKQHGLPISMIMSWGFR